MIKAITENSPEPNSPLFVFTDAPPKDAKEEHEVLKYVAELFGVSVNFFVAKDCGGPSNEPFKPYKEVAESTSGHVFNLPSTNLIRNMTG